MSSNPFKYGLDSLVKVTLGYDVLPAKVVGLFIHPTTGHPRYIVEYLGGKLDGVQEEHYADTLDRHLVKSPSGYAQDYNPYSPNELVKPAFNP